jgi:hypothetical protein
LNVPQDLQPPRSATSPDHRLSLRTKEYAHQHVRDVDVLAIGWEPDPAAPLVYLVYDPRADEDQRIFWVRGDYVQQIRHAG